jgi:prepilin peptidase CpaA
MLPSFAATATAAFPVLLTWAAVADVAARTIPNAVAVMLAVFFVVFAAGTGLGPWQTTMHFACAAALLAAGFALYLAGLFGGGDAKFLAASGLWFGFDRAPVFLASVALAGGGLSLLCMAADTSRANRGTRAAPAKTIPYGVAIAIGAFAAIPDWLAGSQ